MQGAQGNCRVQKLDRTQRFTKQLSQGAKNFATRTQATNKTIARLSENSQFSKSKTITSVSTRGGSIPKVAAKEAREFGREIN